jgi:aminoglycoside/choline kinase family phosphotransferase
MSPEVFQSAFFGHQAPTIHRQRLAGDGSDRRWYRLSARQRRLIMVDHGITTTLPGSEINAFVRIGTHLHSRGLPVPRILAHDGFSGLVFLEDLGDCHLQQRVRQISDGNRVERLYRQIIDTQIDLTAKARYGFNPDWTCQSRAYTVSLILEKECRYFVDAFLNGYLKMAVAYDDLAAEFERLAQGTVERGVRGLIHRDFQSRNIMIRDDRHYLIDFQGARIGPIQYDLAALLIDPYTDLNHNLRQRLLRYATQQAARRLACDEKQFVQGYRYCAVTRNLQMLGAFGYLSHIKHKTAFKQWIPVAAAMLAGHIRAVDRQAFPKLTAIADRIGRR